MTTYAGNEVFDMVTERGWRRGLGNLWQGEFSSWFRSSRWLKHLLLWVVLVNGFMAIMAYATSQAPSEEGPPLFLMYGIFGSMFVAFGVMIIMQRAIVGEKREGTAAWVLSKPVTRSAFVMSRLIGNTLGIVLTSTLIPGLLVYLTFGVFTPLGWLPPLGFLAGVLVFALHVIFWATLTLMMGTFSESTAGVIAVPIALYFALWFIPTLVPSLYEVSPLVLTFSDPAVMPSIAESLMSGTPVVTWLPLIVTVVACVVFIAVAIWRFNRQEF
jgi:ABC-2 type transport system permease protein